MFKNPPINKMYAYHFLLLMRSVQIVLIEKQNVVDHDQKQKEVGHDHLLIE